MTKKYTDKADTKGDIVNFNAPVTQEPKRTDTPLLSLELVMAKKKQLRNGKSRWTAAYRANAHAYSNNVTLASGAR